MSSYRYTTPKQSHNQAFYSQFHSISGAGEQSVLSSPGLLVSGARHQSFTPLAAMNTPDTDHKWNSNKTSTAKTKT